MTDKKFPSIQQLLESMPLHIYWVGRDGRYLGCNNTQAKSSGLPNKESVVGKTNLELPIFKDFPEKAFEIDKINETVMSTKTPFTGEEEGYDSNANKAIFLSYKYPVINENDLVIGMVGVSFDTTEHIKKLEELVIKYEKNQTVLSSILAELPENVYWLDTNNVVLGCNELLAKSSGLNSREEAMGKNVSLFLTPEQREIVLRNNEEVIKHGKIIKDEESLTLPDGKEHYFISKKTPLREKDGTISGLLGISFDITDLKESQEREKVALEKEAEFKAKVQAQEEVQKALLTFTGTMSHDLRTPLSSIQVNTEFLKKMLPILVTAYKKLEELGEETQPLNEYQISLLEDSYQNIMSATRQAESYIDTTLTILKGAATGSELLKPEDLVPCSIEEIIRRVLRNYPFKEGESDKLHSDTVEGFKFKGNSIFMARVLQNLIKNAFEQIHLKARGEIFIYCEQGESLNYLYVKDTAGGVTPSLLEHLFDVFNSTKVKGTGLGLSSAKQIMKAFGGDISCHLIDQDFIEFKLSFPKSLG